MRFYTRGREKGLPKSGTIGTAQPAQNRKSWFSKSRRRLQTAGMFGLAPCIGIALLFFTYSLRFPDPLSPAHKQQVPIIHILAHDGSELATTGLSADYTPLDLLSQHVIDAVISTEDRRFYSHWGIDPWGAAASNSNQSSGWAICPGRINFDTTARQKSVFVE